MEKKKLLALLATQNVKKSDLIAAGYSAADLRATGYSAADLRAYESDFAKIPVLEKPYSKLWADIQAKRRVHNQSDWGPYKCPDEKNICNTAMCTAGHLVNLGNAYWAVEKYGWTIAASMVHQRSTSANLPQQNYGSIPQEWALAFIEENAKMENS